MLASDFCALASRRPGQCSAVALKQSTARAFTQARQEILRAQAMGTSQRCPAARGAPSARVTSAHRPICHLISELLD